jgi:hypothetical protein
MGIRKDLLVTEEIAESSDHRATPRLRARNFSFHINQAARDRWMRLMNGAFGEAALPKEAEQVLRKFLDQMSTFMINQSESGISEREVMRRGGEWSYQRTPQRSKDGRKSSTRFRDGSDFLRTIAPNQHVVKRNARLAESWATEAPFSM